MSRGVLWLEQAAPQRRFGIKGPRAAALLEKQGFIVPDKPNTWVPLRAQEHDDALNVIARLGNTEFFIEEQGDAPGIVLLEQITSGEFDGAYPVLREDTALVLGGARSSAALAEVCNVDFAALDAAHKPVVMTLMAGVGVLVLPQRVDEGIHYRIWCDPSFGSYLWETLQEVVSTTTGRAE